MPYYRVIIHGKNLNFYLQDYEHIFGKTFTMSDVNKKSSVIGFLTTRLAKADNITDAVERINQEVYNEWTLGKYSKIESSNNLILSIDSIVQISTISGMYHSLPRIPLIADVFSRFPTKGFSFYVDG